MKGFVESVSASAIEGAGSVRGSRSLGIPSREIEIFDEWDIFNNVVDELSVLYFKEGKHYGSVKRFLSQINKDPEVRRLEEQQRYFVETAARIYFYSRSLGLGSDFIAKRLGGIPLSDLSMGFVWQVLFRLYDPGEEVSDDTARIVKQSYERYVREAVA